MVAVMVEPSSSVISINCFYADANSDFDALISVCAEISPYRVAHGMGSNIIIYTYDLRDPSSPTKNGPAYQNRGMDMRRESSHCSRSRRPFRK